MAAGLVLLLPVLLLGILGLAVLGFLTITARPDHTLSAEVASARRHSLTTSVAAGAVFAGAGAFLIWYSSLRPTNGPVPSTPTWLGALPLIGAAAALPVLALGELTWPRPRGVQRQVHLNPRTMRDVVPRGWVRLAVGIGLITIAVIAAGWWASDPSGHSITVHHPAERLTHVASPFPGSDYGLPQLVAAAVVLLMLLGVLRLVVLRPAVVRSDVATDNRLRSASGVRAVRVVVSALALTSAANTIVGGFRAISVHNPGWEQNLSVASVLLGVVLGILGAVVVLVPAPRLPRTGPSSPSDIQQSVATS